METYQAQTLPPAGVHRAGCLLRLGAGATHWAFSLSLKTPGDILRIPTSFIFNPTLMNYVKVFQTGAFMHQFGNSLIIGAGSTFLALLVGVPAAYTLQRYRFTGTSGWTSGS